mmetsp:Transcript_117514/g.163611  ORF Transcript_117514/g.163611 Transcript_117514/m.163611 type:complete len:87 (-) Transcript_117514:40-300(-)
MGLNVMGLNVIGFIGFIGSMGFIFMGCISVDSCTCVDAPRSLQTQVAVNTSPLCDVDAEQSPQPAVQQTVTPLDCAAPERPQHMSP